MQHCYTDLINLFEHAFFQHYNTQLIKGDEEPIYLPARTKANQSDHHQIVFAHGYYASALHEIAHWCVAGDARRKLEDYGYWYTADGRDHEQQQKFEKVEIKPQAIEWILSAAAQFTFRVSTDNLNGTAEPDRYAFRRLVHQQVALYLAKGLPQRVATLVNALAHFYQTPLPLTLDNFTEDETCVNSK
nr:elongation factor P hydroxylase [Algibacillus agarilyticus]